MLAALAAVHSYARSLDGHQRDLCEPRSPESPYCRVYWLAVPGVTSRDGSELIWSARAFDQAAPRMTAVAAVDPTPAGKRAILCAVGQHPLPHLPLEIPDRTTTTGRLFSQGPLGGRLLRSQLSSTAIPHRGICDTGLVCCGPPGPPQHAEPDTSAARTAR